MWAIKAIEGEARVVEVPRPVPGPGEVLIEVRAAGVNRADLLQVAGHYDPPPGAPDTLGIEVAGVVVEVGADVASPGGAGVEDWLGRPVVALVGGGAQAEFCLARAQHCISLPRSGRMDGFVAGAALLESAVTVWHNFVDLEPRLRWVDGADLEIGVAPGTLPGVGPSVQTWRFPKDFTVFIHGGSGAVGSFAIQLARCLGAQVAASAGDASRREKLLLLGARAAADYRDEADLLRARQEVSAGRGFDLILDVSGAGGLERNLELLAPGGRLAIIGLQKGRRAEVDLGKVLSLSAMIQGSTIRALSHREKARLVLQVEENVWPCVEQGLIRPVVAQTYHFDQVAEAHAELASRTQRPFGKLVLSRD